jgi:serine/threonine-protein kinase RsbW
MPATSEAPEQGNGTQAPGGLRPGMRWRRVLPGEERQLGVLRQWLASLLPACSARDDVTAVVHELGSNAVRHTASGRGGWFAVEVTWFGPVVRVAVADSGSPDAPRLVDDPAGEHGRGLMVVRGLSERTGVIGDRRGRLVWADVRWDDASSAVAGERADAYEAAVWDGEAALARRFAGMPTWFGRATLAWWALTGPGLVTAASATELASLLYRLQEPLPRGPIGQTCGGADQPQDARRERRGRSTSSGAETSSRPGQPPGMWPGPDSPHRASRNYPPSRTRITVGRPYPALTPLPAVGGAASALHC